LNDRTVRSPDRLRAGGARQRHLLEGVSQHLVGPQRVELIEAVEEEHVDRELSIHLHEPILPRWAPVRVRQNGHMSQGSRHRVAALAIEEVVAFDLTTITQTFGHPDEREHYLLEVCAVEPGPVATHTGFSLLVSHGLEALARADTVFVPGFVGEVPEAARAALRAAAGRGARMVSICTGAFALAASGLLDNRRATTHWADAPELAGRYPSLKVDASPLFIDEGQILTSAGVSAGIDLCLYLVQRDLGVAEAHRIARRMVAAPQRDGGQAQFIEGVGAGESGDLAATRAWMLEQLATPLSIEAMAAHAHFSERTFARRFHGETGMSPLRWLHAQRILEARRLLETTDLPIETIAYRCGFGSATALRTHFRASVKTTPTAYRATWRQRRPSPNERTRAPRTRR
jgi:transcriptional regulator GlxA family with amidase domain